VPARTAAPEGSMVPLYVASADLHPFNSQTGKRTD